MSGKRERSENWSKEEKNYLIELVRERKVIENKSNDINIIRERKKAWLEIESLLKVSGYERSGSRIKEQWRRMKGAAKTSVSKYNRAAKQTGGGSPPEMPAEADWMIREMCPDDFVVDASQYDSEAVEEQIQREQVPESTILVLDPVTGTFIPEPSTPIENPEPPTENPESSSISKPKQKKRKREELQMTSYEKELLNIQKKNYEAEDRRNEEIHKEMLKKIETENDATKQKLAKELELLELEKRKLMLQINDLEKK